MSLKEVTSCLYVYDASDDLSENKSKNINETSFYYSLVSTVHNNEKKFTNRQMRAAKLALEIYNKIGRPSQQVFVQALENNIIRDSPILAADTKRALSIYGKDVANIRGKTKQSSPNHVENPKLINIPDYILKWYHDVTLCIDIFMSMKFLSYTPYHGSYSSERRNTLRRRLMIQFYKAYKRLSTYMKNEDLILHISLQTNNLSQLGKTLGLFI